ncbi:MAG: tetratricopeptide repeat protein [Flavihumibacter sp.]|nr:tetratricopeptide repeat protein [Flavihumibacter sp.]
MRIKPRLLLCIFNAIIILLPLLSEAKILPEKEWIRSISDPAPFTGDSLEDFHLWSVDMRLTYLSKIDNKAKGPHFKARINILKAYNTYLGTFEAGYIPEEKEKKIASSKIFQWLDEAIQQAYASEDDYLIADISFNYGEIAHLLQEFEVAMMYLINGLERNEKLNRQSKSIHYLVLGELLYKIKEYQESIFYSLKSVDFSKSWLVKLDSTRFMWAYNTAALGFHQLEQYDSAFLYYNKAIELAKALNYDVWIGILSGNIGEVYYKLKQYNKALDLLLFDYSISKKEKLLHNAANSLQRAAEIQLVFGNQKKALDYIREVFIMLSVDKHSFYERNAYYTAYEIHKAIGRYDSALHYNKKYEYLKDSLDRVIALSSLKISKIRANDEKNRYQVIALQREKENKELQRNILIIMLILLGFIGLLLFNRHQLQNRLKLEQMERDKKSMETEMESARQQLSIITQKVTEKTNLIEKLEEQILHKTNTEDQQALIAELTRQTILTEEEWYRFKSLFQTIYPSFFARLKEQVPDITLAEQRLAALIRLQLTTKQMASMLGISADSVHKTRQRLRQRLNITKEVNMEAYVAAI